MYSLLALVSCECGLGRAGAHNTMGFAIREKPGQLERMHQGAVNRPVWVLDGEAAAVGNISRLVGKGMPRRKEKRHA